MIIAEWIIESGRARCPVCDRRLYVAMGRSEKADKEFYKVECGTNPAHIRAFLNKIPSLEEVDFDNWDFNPSNVTCPVCGADVDGGISTKQDSRNGKIRNFAFWFCTDCRNHFRAFLNRPDDIKEEWFDTEEDEEETIEV